MVAKALYRTHVEGRLKSEIIQRPERYVELDPDMVRAGGFAILSCAFFVILGSFFVGK